MFSRLLLFDMLDFLCTLFYSLLVVPVRIDGAYAGKVYLFHNGTWKSIAMHEWTLTNAKVICRQLDFKDAIAPFSTDSTLAAKSNKCVPRLNCSGKEVFLGSCSLNVSSTCNPNSEGVASVTCDPSKCVSSERNAIVVRYPSNCVSE